MGSMSYGYNVRTERLRVVGLPELFAFLILIGVVCWMLFPRDLSSSLRTARLDAVTFSYMQAWLKAKPDDQELRLLMARELILQGNFVAADEQLQVVAADNNGRYDTQIAWLELRRDFTRLMAIDADNRRGTMLEHETLTRLRAIDWASLNSEKRIRFADMALAMGSVDLAVQAYRRLADSAANPASGTSRRPKCCLPTGAIPSLRMPILRPWTHAGITRCANAISLPHSVHCKRVACMTRRSAWLRHASVLFITTRRCCTA